MSTESTTEGEMHVPLYPHTSQKQQETIMSVFGDSEAAWHALKQKNDLVKFEIAMLDAYQNCKEKGFKHSPEQKFWLHKKATEFWVKVLASPEAKASYEKQVGANAKGGGKIPHVALPNLYAKLKEVAGDKPIKLDFEYTYCEAAGGNAALKWTHHVRLRVMGQSSSAPGEIGVSNGKAYGDPENRWYGMIKQGVFQPSKYVEPHLLAELQKMDDNFEAYVVQYGAMTGYCMFCHSPLTDAKSLAHGYGPVCAKKWKLQWDGKVGAHSVLGPLVTEMKKCGTGFKKVGQKVHNFGVQSAAAAESMSKLGKMLQPPDLVTLKQQLEFEDALKADPKDPAHQIEKMLNFTKKYGMSDAQLKKMLLSAGSTPEEAAAAMGEDFDFGSLEEKLFASIGVGGLVKGGPAEQDSFFVVDSLSAHPEAKVQKYMAVDLAQQGSGGTFAMTAQTMDGKQYQTKPLAFNATPKQIDEAFAEIGLITKSTKNGDAIEISVKGEGGVVTGSMSSKGESVQEVSKNSSFVYCGACQQKNYGKHSKHCKSCGAPLYMKASKVLCSGCEKENPAKYMHCQYCDAPLPHFTQEKKLVSVDMGGNIVTMAIDSAAYEKLAKQMESGSYSIGYKQNESEEVDWSEPKYVSIMQNPTMSDAMDATATKSHIASELIVVIHKLPSSDEPTFFVKAQTGKQQWTHTGDLPLTATAADLIDRMAAAKLIMTAASLKAIMHAVAPYAMTGGIVDEIDMPKLRRSKAELDAEMAMLKQKDGDDLFSHVA